MSNAGDKQHKNSEIGTSESVPPQPSISQLTEEQKKSLEAYIPLLNGLIPDTWRNLPKKTRTLLCRGLGKEQAEQTFKEIVITTLDTLIPPELFRLSVSELTMFVSWKCRLDSIARDKNDLTLMRALHQGLVFKLIERPTFETECHAWALSAAFGSGGIFNKTQTLPGYDKACNSVHVAIRRKQEARSGNAHTRGLWGKKLATAMLSYWLPLGLWAMSIEDALEALRLFSVPAQMETATTAEKVKVQNAVPAEWESSELLKITPKKRSWHLRFSRAVSDLQLFQTKTPMVTLEYNFMRAKKQDINNERREAENWSIIFKPGFNCAGYW